VGIGPISQGPDKGMRFVVVKKEMGSGLNKIVGMVEAYERLSAQYLQLAFNWHIIKAPHSIGIYVVLHELCRLVYPNHSKEFWTLAARYDASYPEDRAFLMNGGFSALSTVSVVRKI